MTGKGSEEARGIQRDRMAYLASLLIAEKLLDAGTITKNDFKIIKSNLATRHKVGNTVLLVRD